MNCPPPAHVQVLSFCIDVTSKDAPALFVTQFYGYGLGMIGGVAILFIMYGGYNILTSQGNPLQVAKGRSYIMYAIIGLLLAIFGFVIMEIIAGNILHVPGIS